MSCCAVVLDNLVALSGIIGIVVEQSGLGAAVWRLRLMGSMHQGEGTRGRELKSNCIQGSIEAHSTLKQREG